jgi:type I restriction enzyme S subunit
MSEPRNGSNSGFTAPNPGVVMDVQETNATYLLPAEGQVPKGYKQTEVGVIPEDWGIAKFRDVTRVITCGLAATPIYVEEQFGQPFLSAQNVRNGKVVYDNHRYISNELFTQITKHNKPECGDILYTRVGAGIGEAAVIPDNYAFGIYVSLTLIKIASTKANSYFISHLLNSDRYRFLAKNGQFAGGGVQNLNVEVVREFDIPIPTLPEQEAIAEALSDADALIEALEQLVAKKRQLKQGAMQELLTGKRRLPGFSGEWEIKPLGEIGESIIGLTYSPNDVRADGVLVLRSSNVQEGALSFQDNIYVELEISERIMVRAGDILICVRNGSRDLIGKCAKIDDRCKGMTFGAFMSVFRTPFHNFVFHQFQSNVIKRQINEHLGATINQITNKSLNSFQIPFPKDETEQTAIAQILTDMDAEITELESKLTKARAVKQGMMQQLLTGRIRLL